MTEDEFRKKSVAHETTKKVIDKKPEITENFVSSNRALKEIVDKTSEKIKSQEQQTEETRPVYVPPVPIAPRTDAYALNPNALADSAFEHPRIESVKLEQRIHDLKVKQQLQPHQKLTPDELHDAIKDYDNKVMEVKPVGVESLFDHLHQSLEQFTKSHGNVTTKAEVIGAIECLKLNVLGLLDEDS